MKKWEKQSGNPVEGPRGEIIDRENRRITLPVYEDGSFPPVTAIVDYMWNKYKFGNDKVALIKAAMPYFGKGEFTGEWEINFNPIILLLSSQEEYDTYLVMLGSKIEEIRALMGEDEKKEFDAREAYLAETQERYLAYLRS